MTLDVIEYAVLQAVTAPAGTLEDAVRAWEPAAELVLAEITQRLEGALPSP